MKKLIPFILILASLKVGGQQLTFGEPMGISRYIVQIDFRTQVSFDTSGKMKIQGDTAKIIKGIISMMLKERRRADSLQSLFTRHAGLLFVSEDSDLDYGKMSFRTDNSPTITHGLIEFSPDTTKLCGTYTIPGTKLTEFRGAYYIQAYFDGEGRMMIRDRFKKGKVLRFYETEK